MDKVTLETLVNQGKSSYEISQVIGLAPTPVRYWLKKHGLKTQWSGPKKGQPRPKRLRVFSDEEIATIQRFYDNGGTYRTIATTFAINAIHVRRLVKEGRLRIRSLKEAAKQAKVLGRRDQFQQSAYRERMSARQKERLRQHPEIHPNRLLAANRKTMSFPERQIFDALTKLGILFEHNGQIGRYYVDFLFPTFGIEVDGKRWHNAQRDAKRDAEIATRGIEIVRFDSQIAVKQPQIIIAEIQKRLSSP